MYLGSRIHTQNLHFQRLDYIFGHKHPHCSA